MSLARAVYLSSFTVRSTSRLPLVFLLCLAFEFIVCHPLLYLCNSTLWLLVLCHEISLGVSAKPDRKLGEFFLQSLDRLYVHVRLSDEFRHIHWCLVSIPQRSTKRKSSEVTYLTVEQGALHHNNRQHLSPPSPYSDRTPTTSSPQTTVPSLLDTAGSLPMPARNTPSCHCRTPRGFHIRDQEIYAASLLGSMYRL